MSNTVAPNAKFFCESCGAEVPRNAKFCRHCGRFFSSVRCPQCGATGSPDQFTDGCPACGYTVDSGVGRTTRNTRKKETATRAAKKRLRAAINTKAPFFSGTARGDEALPFWMYLVTGLVLLGLLFFIMRYFGR